MRDFAQDHSSLALNTATLGHNLAGHGAGWSSNEIIDACAKRGFGGIVFWRREIDGSAYCLGEKVRSSGMRVAGLCRAPFLVGPLAHVRPQLILDEFKASIDLAAELSAPTLTVVAGGVERGTKGVTESLKLVSARVFEAAEYAARVGVKLALEPLNPVYGGDRSCLTTTRDAVDIIQDLGADNVGVALDVYHVWWDTELQSQLNRLPGSKIFGLHLSDWLAETTDVLLDRGMMGDGVADIRKIREIVEGVGYSGFCEVEIFSANNWWRRAPDDVLDTVVERYKVTC